MQDDEDIDALDDLIFAAVCEGIDTSGLVRRRNSLLHGG
jgi:hypothetical protein